MKIKLSILMLALFICVIGNTQTVLTGWQADKSKAESDYKIAKTIYEKDTTKSEAKHLLDSLGKAIKNAEQQIKVGENNLNALITGQYITRMDSLQRKVDGLSSSESDKGKHFTWERLFLILLAFAVAFLSVLVFKLRNTHKRRDEILKTVTELDKKEGIHRMQYWKNSLIEEVISKAKPSLISEVTGINTKISETDSLLQDLRKRLAHLEDKSRIDSGNNANNTTKGEVGANFADQSVRTLYADAIIKGEFNKITDHPDDDTIFELLLNVPSGRKASFSIFKDAYRRVLKNADFIDGCEKQRINFSPNNLDVSKGEATLLDNGKWQITKKAEVKFI